VKFDDASINTGLTNSYQAATSANGNGQAAWGGGDKIFCYDFC
jgi:hypothetical protein